MFCLIFFLINKYVQTTWICTCQYSYTTENKLIIGWSLFFLTFWSSGPKSQNVLLFSYIISWYLNYVYHLSKLCSRVLRGNKIYVFLKLPMIWMPNHLTSGCSDLVILQTNVLELSWRLSLFYPFSYEHLSYYILLIKVRLRSLYGLSATTLGFGNLQVVGLCSQFAIG